MREIGAVEARNRLGYLLDCVELGEEVTITRRGKAVARLVGHSTAVAGDAMRAAERIRARAEGAKRTGLGWRELRAYRDEGRA